MVIKCKCNAGGRGIPTFSHCSTTANPSLTDDGFKLKNIRKLAWLTAKLKSNRFKIPHYTCTRPLPTILKNQNNDNKTNSYIFNFD